MRCRGLNDPIMPEITNTPAANAQIPSHADLFLAFNQKLHVDRELTGHGLERLDAAANKVVAAVAKATGAALR